ncbi:MAG: hypothetical protein ACOX84_08325 [Methanothrix sp.]|uniref:hypothetical protein n=2 Tax=Methanothrix sp. TaxID=90426 RepID=UPI001BD59EB2
MIYRQRKALLALWAICIGILLFGLAIGQNTYDAYPGAPTPVTTQIPTPASIVGEPSAAQQQQTAAMTTSIVSSSSATATAVYSAQAPPATHQNVLLTYDVQTAPPSAVYYSGSYLPWTSFYQVFSANAPALWISSSLGWAWYATSPAGSWVQELMYVPVTGSMKVYDLYPDGTTRYVNYGFATPGYKLRWFRADTPGRYMTMVTIADIPSNYIIVDAA